MKIILLLSLISLSFAQTQHRTLQGALTLLEQAQYEDPLSNTKFDQLKQFTSIISDKLQVLRENKLSQEYPLLDSVPIIMLLSASMPILIVLLFTWISFQFMKQSDKGKMNKYVKLPQSKDEKSKEPKRSYYPEEMAFSFM